MTGRRRFTQASDGLKSPWNKESNKKAKEHHMLDIASLVDLANLLPPKRRRGQDAASLPVNH
jgi:hypothetical protein